MKRIDVKSRLDKAQARKLLAKIFGSKRDGTISFGRHAKERMKERNLGTNDIFNVLSEGQIYHDPENKKGSWRYRVETNKIAVIFVFRDIDGIAIVTTWRK